jgi:hypothetical protein
MSEILSAETVAGLHAPDALWRSVLASHEALRAERDAAARITRESRRRETEQRARAGNAEKSVRVLTEALALLLAGVETGHFNTAIDDARSVLASVPSEPTCPDCGSPVRAQFGVACQTMHHAWHDTMPASVPSGALWSCSHCGPHPDSTANWCAAGCGSDYNRMTSMPREAS